MTTITIIYALSLLIFGFFAGFIVRHTVRYGYLSPRFKIAIFLFGAMALGLILFSLTLLLRLWGGNFNPGVSRVGIPTRTGPAGSELNF